MLHKTTACPPPRQARLLRLGISPRGKQLSPTLKVTVFMKWTKSGSTPVRLLIVVAGYAITAGLVYAAGLWLVPITDPYDKAILAAINPDNYAPGFDQFFRFLTDYTNPLIILPMVSWLIARGLYRLFPNHKGVFTGLLFLETIVLTVLTALGRIWPNTTYMGVNIMADIVVFVVFSMTAVIFHKMENEAMHRLACVFGLMILSGAITDWGATGRIKGAVARPRPFNDANKPWNLQVRPIPDEYLRGANSFPSGHTSGTFALLTPLFWYVRDRRIRAGLLTWATLQGVSRVYTAAHFPFCCLMGGILGFTIGTIVFFALGGPSLRREPEPAPEPSPQPA